ncbi:protein PET117 homolog, mitochondrial-like [Entelurus aequoreus]|uniref:protein PET117 homolog, mitochondrial-like n=1 Tax=Entelurus aequoreus TaxID=161455 RepID=UPI002B1CE92E|nr:protein PET117 homolog, mitochondrial-like [Entelurus aequoreus]XP_061889343.1 protein PET117 homolog, mitochondrial-like [Entelurus aequoreus]
MSAASKLVLGLSVVVTVSVVAAVHLQQGQDRQRLQEGVLRDLERVERKKENLRLLEENQKLATHLQEDRRRREANLRPQDLGQH